MASNWFYAKNGKQLGPVSSGQLREMTGNGQLLATDMIWKDGMAAWTQAGALPDLFPVAPPHLPPPLPQQVVAYPPPRPAPFNFTEQSTGPEGYGGQRKNGITPWYKTAWFRLMCGFLGLIIPCLGVLRVVLPKGHHPDVVLVMNGRFQVNQSMTVGQAVHGFMGDSKWEAINGEDGKHYVNVSGDITYLEKPIRATFQFQVNRKQKTFDCVALEFNGVPQNKLIMVALLSKMYGEPESTDLSLAGQKQGKQVPEMEPKKSETPNQRKPGTITKAEYDGIRGPVYRARLAELFQSEGKIVSTRIRTERWKLTVIEHKIWLVRYELADRPGNHVMLTFEGQNANYHDEVLMRKDLVDSSTNKTIHYQSYHPRFNNR